MLHSSALSFEGEGYVESIYSMLWTKDPVFGTSESASCLVSLIFDCFILLVPSLLIPDTVVYKFGDPQVWFFTSEGQVKRKNKIKVNNVEIEKAFLQFNQPCKVLAYFMHMKEGSHGEVIFEYLDEDLFSKPKKLL